MKNRGRKQLSKPFFQALERVTLHRVAGAPDFLPKGLLTEVIRPLFYFGGADTPPQLYIFEGGSTVTDLDRLFISRKTTEIRFIQLYILRNGTEMVFRQLHIWRYDTEVGLRQLHISRNETEMVFRQLHIWRYDTEVSLRQLHISRNGAEISF